MAALTARKPFQSLNHPMARRAIRKTTAPTPRLTPWVPALITLALSLGWLGLLALFQR
jgi:hypothetical protein